VSGFANATRSYERWRASRIEVVAEDLRLKHERLAVSPFVMLRGSYYRFLQQFGRVTATTADAPPTVAVGDLHIENFGTWRDRDGRLVWGVNDFDEVDLLPYTIDLVRLGCSALLAIAADHLALEPAAACDAILRGWSERIEEPAARSFVLGEHHRHLYRLASEAFAPPVGFMRKLAALPPWTEPLPKLAARLLTEVVPWPGFEPSLHRRVAGVGSLGSRRIVALGELSGGPVMRECKQIPGPASLWAFPSRKRPRGVFEAVAIARGVAADPWRVQRGKWVLRPLAPDATRLELAALRRRHDEAAMLVSMGAEAANVHLTRYPAAATPKAVRADASQRPAGWLHEAAATMATACERDHLEWSDSRK
jgi:hypothetical protein